LCRKENNWVLIDKTADASASVVGVLKNDWTISEKSFLLSCQEMFAVEHTTVAYEAMKTP
jgi:hypothetical protein